jgi:hypothetical protein
MRLAQGLRIFVVAVACLVGGKGIASVEASAGHKTSLPAVLTMADGTTKAVTLKGVGCAANMCSRVRARENNSGSIWLDGLASIRQIRDANGAVEATFTFKNGIEREGSLRRTTAFYTSRVGLGVPRNWTSPAFIGSILVASIAVPQYPKRYQRFRLASTGC